MRNSIFHKALLFSTCVFSFHAATFAAENAKTEITQAESDEEAFLIRRIAEFWKDGDYGIVKTQILDFLDQYPNSQLNDYFLGILGDIYLQENHYQNALSSYQKIEDPSVKEKIILNQLQCYYELDQYEKLASEGTPFVDRDVPSINERRQELHFLLGEAFFRQALVEKESVKKQELATSAKRHYDLLHSGQYKNISEFALAEIYGILGDHRIAAEAYESLAQSNPNMKEDLLFQAASLKAKYDRSEAAQLFSSVKGMGGKRAQEAAFNLMVLLFQTEEYEKVIASADQIAPHVPEAYMPTFHFIVGKSYFSLGNYKQAIDSLTRYIEGDFVPSDQLKNALLIQMTCAHQVNDEGLFSRYIEKFDTLFPKDPELPKALFMHAMILKEQGNIALADEKLKQIKEDYSDFQEHESFVFEYGVLAHQNERWEESYQAFKSYILQFPESTRMDIAWKLFLSSSLNFYKEANESEEVVYSKADFFADLQSVLEHRDFLNDEEMKDYSLLYAKTAYELDRYSEALRCLQDTVFTSSTLTEESDPLALAEAHFIAGLCYAELGADISAFCMHLEQAMLLSPELYDSATTHLQLYNAYISLAGFGDGGQVPEQSSDQKSFIAQAAEHLHEALTRGGMEIKRENKLWLANHYYQKAKDYFDVHTAHQVAEHPEVSSDIERATLLYQSLLFEGGVPVSLTTENLFLENELLKFAKLMEFQNQSEKKLFVLKSLLEQQSQKPELNWSSQKEALYELATAYDAIGDYQKAFETYNFINSSSQHFPTRIANASILKSARIHFQLLDEAMKDESNEEVLAILNDLKELQIRKNVTSEPIHLEAALDYAQIRSEISDAEQKDARYLFFLSRIKDDFTSQEDLVTQDYLVNLNRDPSKKQVFDSYMKFIEAEKFRIEAKQLYREERLNEMEELHENALTLYSEIKNDPTTPEHLFERITQSIQDINALNAY